MERAVAAGSLSRWHRWAPPAEAKAGDLGDRVTLADYLGREERVFAELRAEIEDRLAPGAQTLGNRYWRNSLSHATVSPRTGPLLSPRAAAPRCGALMLHGLTDSPYSMRSLARVFSEEGCTVLALRMPGHGTTPRGLVEADWEDWAAAVRIGWRSLAASAPEEQPLFLVGYSNGGALAVDAALDLGSERRREAPGGTSSCCRR